MKHLVLLLSLSILFYSCNNSKKETSAFEKQRQANNHPGKKLMEIYCYTCHSPTASEDNRIAPPMIAIKKHYINNNTSKKEFIEAMQNWIKNPSEKISKMPGAVNRFGIMPKTPYPEENIKQIADYMFEFEIEQPDWFEDHYNKNKQKLNE